jgi:glycosyltransferase involved in cell wall biosynthesis
MNKLVSVMIPVYNGADFVGQAIKSVLNQDYDRIEIIVINDGSTDNTSEVLEKFKDSIKIVNQSNMGISATRQRAIEEATGEYFAFLDHDDMWTSNAVRLRVEALENNPDIQIVFGHQQYFFDEHIDEALKHRLEPNYIQKPIPAEMSTTAILTLQTFIQVGNFTDDSKMHPFLDWYGRAKEKGLQSLVLPDLILYRRIHNRNTSRLRTNSLLPGTLKQMLDRRRNLETQSNHSS